MESSKDVDVCVFDKTGTITEGKPEVEDIETFGMEEDKFLQVLSSVENNSSHPIATSILNRFKTNNIQLSNEGKDDLALLNVEDFENVTALTRSLSTGILEQASAIGAHIFTDNTNTANKLSIPPNGWYKNFFLAFLRPAF